VCELLRVIWKVIGRSHALQVGERTCPETDQQQVEGHLGNQLVTSFRKAPSAFVRANWAPHDALQGDAATRSEAAAWQVG